MRLLAIDPGTRALGFALFFQGQLIKTKTYRAEDADSIVRTLKIIGELALDGWIADRVVIEDPVIQGRANQMIQKMIGCVMGLYHYAQFNFYSPTYVKKIFGSGKLEKLDVALAAGNFLKTKEEKEILAQAIADETWDETDAIAIGLTYLKGENHVS